MAVGISTSAIANKWLDTLGAVDLPGFATVYVKLHIGDPGAAGANAPSTETTRKLITWTAAAAGSKAMSGVLTWSGWSVGVETLSHVSLWDSVTGGVFLWSGALGTPKIMSDGDSLSITTLVVSISPLSA